MTNCLRLKQLNGRRPRWPRETSSSSNIHKAFVSVAPYDAFLLQVNQSLGRDVKTLQSNLNESGLTLPEVLLVLSRRLGSDADERRC